MPTPRSAQNANSALAAINRAIHEGRFVEARALLENLKQDCWDVPTVRLNRSAQLVDIGSGLRSAADIQAGIRDAAERSAERAFRKHRAMLTYNQANGHLCLFELAREKSRTLDFILDNEDLQRAKIMFREALAAKPAPRPNLEKMIWTNYANCLDYLGRALEAIDAYDRALELDPNFRMALGNKALALKSFADISGEYRLPTYVKAHQMLREALGGPPDTDELGWPARESLATAASSIEELVPDKSLLSSDLSHPPLDYAAMPAFQRAFVDLCSRESLYLNVHVHVKACAASARDPVSLQLPALSHRREVDRRLLAQFNHLKEEYALARFLLVLSQHPSADVAGADALTAYTIEPNGLTFGIEHGLLKASFQIAYNILDKIARFTNDYLSLKIEGKIYFTNVWTVKNANGDVVVRDKIRAAAHPSLFALVDIQKDLQSDRYRRIRELRDLMTHEYLSIGHVRTSGGPSNRDARFTTSAELLEQTIKLLQMVRSAIIYLMSFVNARERGALAATADSGPAQVDPGGDGTPQ